MSGVALRCPTCGTTQAENGECEACFEGEVRYFCDNHSPGLWLDEPVCTRCGARFGDAPPKRPEPGRTSTPTRRPRRPPSLPPSPRGAEPSRTGLGRPLPRPADPAETPAPTSLDELLVHMSEARERARYEAEERERRWTPVESPRRSIPILGCLIRLVFLVLLVIAFALGGLFLLLGG